MSIDLLISELERALEAYLASSPDHFAAQEVRQLMSKLRNDPERTVQDIGNFFNSPKTAVTDSFQSSKTREMAELVEQARKPLGNYFARLRISRRP